MTNPAYSLPLWLTDEQQLRDEAVVFGLSEARPDEKIAAIRLAFAALTAAAEKRIEQQHETIGDLNFRIQSIDNQVEAKTPASTFSTLGDWPVVLFLGGLALSLLLCTGTYLGSFSLLASPQLSLLLTGLVGVSSCTGTLLACQAAYRKKQSIDTVMQQQQHLLLKTKLELAQQKQLETAQLYAIEADLNQQYAQRDMLIRLFESEFDLARSLRHQFSDSYADR